MDKLKLLVVLVVIIASSGCMEDVIRTVDTYPILYINASNITTVGANATGSLQNISEINYGYYNVSESTTPFYTNVNFTNITNFSFLEVKAKYFSTTGTPSTHVVDLEIYCTIDNDYEDLFFLENANEWRYFTRHFPDAEHFIDSTGNVSIRFNHTANGNVNHRLYIDSVRLIIKESFEQNTITLYQNFTTSGSAGTLNHYNLTNKSLSDHNITADFSFNGYNITTTKGIYQEYSEINTSITNNCDDNNLNITGNNCPRTLQKLKTNFSNITIRHRLNAANQNYGITLNYNESGYLDNASMSGWGIFYRSLNDDFYIGRFNGSGVAVSEFIWRCQNNASCTFYNNFTVVKNLTVNNLAGAGNAYACLDANGVLYRGSPGC